MADKTKAAMPGRQCNNTKHIQDTRVNAGGQRMSQRNSAPADYIQFFSSSLAFLRCWCLISPTAAMAYTPQPFGSMPCWRNFSRQASSTHAEKFAPGVCDFSSSTFPSISSISSCGKRIFFCADFALIALVAIFPPVCSEGTPYQKKHLTCTPTKNIVGPHLWFFSIQEIAKPGSARTLTGPLTKPLVEVTVMADQQHTQTHPKFTWRFLALSAIERNVIHIIATTESEAREQSPVGCVMVFAGRLPVQEVRHA